MRQLSVREPSTPLLGISSGLRFPKLHLSAAQRAAATDADILFLKGSNRSVRFLDGSTGFETTQNLSIPGLPLRDALGKEIAQPAIRI